jgi:hypothetical protein
MQKRIESGELIEVYAYREELRLPGAEAPRGW